MSKRYGRTKKRKHLELIKKLETEHDFSQHSLEVLGTRLERILNSYNRVVRNIIRSVNNSSLLPPDENPVRYLQPHYHIPIKKMIELNFDFITDASISTANLETVILDMVDVLVKYDGFKRRAHLIIRTGKAGYHYYISPEAINSEDFDYLLEHIYKTCKYELPKLFRDGKL